MIVNYKIINGLVTGYTLLFNEAGGDANEKFAPTFKDTVFKVPGYGAASQIKVPLANTDGQLPLKWSSNYASADAALAAIATLRSTFKGVTVDLQVIEGATTVFFHNATLSSSSHDQHGREVMHSMTFETDDISTA